MSSPNCIAYTKYICTELRIGSDRTRRDEVAAVIMDLAETGERDATAIGRGVRRRLNVADDG
jgi:hypothetical protein